MNLVSRMVGGVALMGLLFAATSSMMAADDDAIKKAMKAINGKGGLKSKIDAAVKAKDPEAAGKAAAEAVPLIEAMCKAKPPKGDEESWKKLTEAYLGAAKKVVEGGEKKDEKLVAAGAKGFGACGGCHKAHKP